MLDLFSLAKPVLHAVDPETAMRFSLHAARLGLVPSQPADRDPILGIELFGRRLTNPVGLAAGYDKNAIAFHKLFAQGFGYLEVGGVTPLPQAGNPRPRLFRLDADAAAINRMGFNNDGMHAVAERVRNQRPSDQLVGVNLASNSLTADPVGDFRQLIECFRDLADFLVVDISCPNTTNGKMFLEPGPLETLLGVVAKAVEGAKARPRLVVKISPDVETQRLAQLVALIAAHPVDGMIISNTTVERPAELGSPNAQEAGGLSGRPLFRRSTEMLAQVYAQTSGKLTLIGTGGVACGADAYAKIRAGASAVQLYTALVFHGPALITRIKTELSDLLRRDGFASVSEAVGADHRAAARRSA